MTTTLRNSRFIENEEIFRGANERLRDRVEPVAAPRQPIPFICECMDETCMARVDLTLDDYERVRSVEEHFVIARGHPRLDGERVVEENDHFQIVTKEDVG